MALFAGIDYRLSPVARQRPRRQSAALEDDLLGIKTEAEKMLMLAALNLVECIAETAPRRTK